MNGHTIEAHPSAPEGSVLQLITYDATFFPPTTMILCRNNAPLVAFAYSLLQRDVPCKILGRDIGASLISLVKKLRATDLDDFLDRLGKWESREAERAVLEDRSPERVYDQTACLRFFVQSLDEDSRSINSLIAKIELMFTDERSDSSRVTLSTVHKAKGLEFPLVYILDFDRYMPSGFAKKDWQRTQERNLIYVAVTRSKDKLCYISSDCWRD